MQSFKLYTLTGPENLIVQPWNLGTQNLSRSPVAVGMFPPRTLLVSTIWPTGRDPHVISAQDLHRQCYMETRPF